MAALPRELVTAPTVESARYGLFSVATIITDSGNGERWEQGGVEFSSVQCAQGTVWAYGCGPAYVVTLTKTATANQWAVTYTPSAGTYEVRINGGGWAVIANAATILTPNASNTVEVREQAGLGRRVSLTAVPNAPANGTTISGSSVTQAYNDPKTGDGKSWQQADPFGVLAGVSCKSVGTLDVDDEPRARAALAAAEQRLVEQVFERSGTPRLAAGGGVVTPGGSTALRIKRAVGVLEQYLGAEYGGVGALHMPRLLGPYAPVSKEGALLRTALGTPVAFGSGYTGVSPAGADAATGTAWIYATGAVQVRRSQVWVPAQGAETLDRSTNDVLLIAERSYMVSIDCVPVAAALVDLNGEDAA
ncbi:hypothetical protein [Micromonospora sp. NPDC049645]|uniref:hypothetical protein n=1 Tax=Micromonospora sp. NPDC049645 TaxID=3155508 RepID=UPI0034418A1A